MRRVGIHAGPLPATYLSSAELVAPQWGALNSFIGVVRNHAHGRAVLDLTYECYVAMAEKILAGLVDDVAAEIDPELGAIVVHGYGPMRPGDVSVAIHVASAHRDAAFRAARALIERLKVDAPVWKHERYADGTSAWSPGS